eukprot:TRINITY_DN18390_c0_g1_i1.p1 TRINITY_DN18390_c0_g1~~TRINITY_DN18390_c0_g1_i1.p1  ORF type:complete len:538 (+),score=139.56 TRINITY_DN18390_c0_g1_i1:901-2514(+)
MATNNQMAWRSGSLLIPVVTTVFLFAIVGADRVPGSPFPVARAGLNASAGGILYLTAGSLNTDDSFTACTLQGVTSRKTPRIFRSNGNGYVTWLAELERTYAVQTNDTYLNDLGGLISVFAPELKGYVLADLADNSSVAALCACAAADFIAVTPNNQHYATAAGLSLAYDVRGKGVEWALAQFNGSGGFEYNRAVSVLQVPYPPSTSFMGDFSTFAGALSWFADDLTTALPSRLLASLESPSTVLGWGADEYHTVSALSKAGTGLIATNWANNLDVLSNFDMPAFQQQPAPSPGPPANVHTVCFTMTDGDNVQWLLNDMTTNPNWFASASRGALPLGWTLSASLADLAPVVMDYLYSAAASNATGRDYFIAGVSGLGYQYPDLQPSAALARLAQLTASFMAKADMHIVNVMDRNGFDVSSAQVYLQQDGIDGVALYCFDPYSCGQGKISFVGDKAILGGRYSLWPGVFDNSTTLLAKLKTLPKDLTSSDGYSWMDVNGWLNSVADVASLASQLASVGGFEVVTPDVYLQRVVANIPH